MGDIPQVVPTDPVPAKASHEPTVYMNYPDYPSMSNTEPQVNAPPPYESHDFTPQFHPRLSTKNSSVFPNVMAASGPGQPHTMDSVYKSSDSASMSTNEKGTLRKISNLQRISIRCPLKKLKEKSTLTFHSKVWLLYFIKYFQIYSCLHFLILLL